MSIANVVRQLRRLPVLGGRVAAGAVPDLQNYQFTTLPAAFVVPLEDVATDNDSLTGLWQVVTQRIGVVVVFPTDTLSGDRRGQGVAELFDITKFSIFRALLNWSPFRLAEIDHDNITTPSNVPDFDSTDPIIGHAARGYQYDGCSLLASDYELSRIVYEFRFSIELTVTDDDGWQLTGVPLEEMVITVIDQETGDVLDIDDITSFPDVMLRLKGVASKANVPDIVTVIVT